MPITVFTTAMTYIYIVKPWLHQWFSSSTFQDISIAFRAVSSLCIFQDKKVRFCLSLQPFENPTRDRSIKLNLSEWTPKLKHSKPPQLVLMQTHRFGLLETWPRFTETTGNHSKLLSEAGLPFQFITKLGEIHITLYHNESSVTTAKEKISKNICISEELKPENGSVCLHQYII